MGLLDVGMILTNTNICNDIVTRNITNFARFRTFSRADL